MEPAQRLRLLLAKESIQPGEVEPAGHQTYGQTDSDAQSNAPAFVSSAGFRVPVQSSIGLALFLWETRATCRSRLSLEKCPQRFSRVHDRRPPSNGIQTMEQMLALLRQVADQELAAPKSCCL